MTVVRGGVVVVVVKSGRWESSLSRSTVHSQRERLKPIIAIHVKRRNLVGRRTVKYWILVPKPVLAIKQD